MPSAPSLEGLNSGVPESALQRKDSGGKFGVYDKAPMESPLRYLKFVIRTAEKRLALGVLAV
jgi:hypothetical protein